MRLSTRPERDDDAAVAVLHAVLDSGVRFLDTADAYAHHPKDIGHNERLIARALASWGGDRSSVTIATKGGLTRPGGKWVPDGRARHLAAACEASLRHLGVEKIALYQLHAPDPKVPLRTSVRALAKLQRDGLVERIGLCNVSVAQIEEARGIVDIASVQVAMHPFDDVAVRGGVVEHCAAHGIELLAYRPLGGEKAQAKLHRDPVIASVAASTGLTLAQVVLAWLRSFGVVPLPGPTRIESAVASGSVVELAPHDLRRLDERYPAADILRRPRAERRAPDDAEGEVVILMGLPAAGKTTRARAYVDRGYVRLNRDQMGGTLSKVARELEAALQSGARRCVLDNTYGARHKRNEVIEIAWRHGLPARCEWLQTTLEQARINAVQRMLEVHGRLLEPDEIAAASRDDPNTFGPRVQIDHRRNLEPPVLDEGFVAIEPIAFVPGPATATGRLLFLDLDAVFGEALQPTERQRNALQQRAAEGWILAGFVWRPALAEGERSRVDVDAQHRELAAELGVPLRVYCCAHAGGPPICWCRPPMPGLVVSALRDADADPQRSLLVGATSTLQRFAEACGIAHASIEELFGA
jgi:aryl-alcohol dehydrogenase-like predicted oxidoreductase/predicted kinase